jgi:hypothetical protein
MNLLRPLALLTLLAAPTLAHAQQGIGTEAWYAVPDARGVQVVHIQCGPNFIDPREIVIEPGKPVELAIRSSEASDEFASGLGARIPVGREPTRHQFVPSARGTHVMSCRKRGASDAETPSRKRGLLHVRSRDERP